MTCVPESMLTWVRTSAVDPTARIVSPLHATAPSAIGTMSPCRAPARGAAPATVQSSARCWTTRVARGRDIGGATSLWLNRRVLRARSPSEQRRADAHECRSFFDGHLKVDAHAHRQFLQPFGGSSARDEVVANLAEPPEPE